MKIHSIVFWTTTIIVCVMEGLIPAFTSQTEFAKQGIKHLGYPEYFANALVIFKVFGALSLIIPLVPRRVKEWAYAGFSFNFVFAGISHFSIDGISFQSFFPFLFLGVLIASYLTYHKLNSITNGKSQ